MAKIFVLIPAYNDIENTLQCVGDLYRQDYPHTEIIVVDGGSSDRTPEVLRKKYPELVVLEGVGNLWWTEAMAQGVDYVLGKAREGDFILSFNQDLRIEGQDYLSDLVTRSVQHNLAIVGSCSTNIKGKIDSAGGKFNWPSPLFLQHTEIMQKLTPCPPWLGDLDFIYGRGTLIPVKVFRAIGNYDARRFPQTHGDIDLAYRARQKGFRLILPLATKLLHTKLPRLHSGSIKPSYRMAWRLLTDPNSYLNLKSRFSLIDWHCPESLRRESKLRFFLYALRESFGRLGSSYRF